MKKDDEMRPNWFYYLLLLLIVEKTFQHILVTLAFYLNWADIAATVVVSPIFLMILGAIVAILFVVSFWGMIKNYKWSVNLVIALALFDILGEFVAQGRLDITINVSILVATLLLIFSLRYRRQFRVA